MPSKEIKELRQAGKLDEALELANNELMAQPDNIWCKRNLSWVLYEFVKINTDKQHFDEFIKWLNEIKGLNLPQDETMLFENLSWQVGKMVFNLMKTNSPDFDKLTMVFEAVKTFQFPKPSEAYSFLFKAFHKAFKDSNQYIEFADWWNLENFREQDFEKEKMENGREIMSIAEQAYNAYSKHLLPKQTSFGEIIFNKEKAEAFLPILSKIVEDFPQFQYPAYFNAKLLLALGNNENMLELLLPFAKKKRNDFWVWTILAEAFSQEPEKVFACYCKALSCKSPEEMLVSLRQKMAAKLIEKNLYNEAKTEIEILVQTRKANEFKIPYEVENWQNMDWYNSAIANNTNLNFYKTYAPIADELLLSDVPEEFVFVEFVNSDKKILNFIASEKKHGFFKYDRFLTNVKIGDVLKVRFQGGSIESSYQILSALKTENTEFKQQFIKEISGAVNKQTNQEFGFIESVYISPAIMKKYHLSDGDTYSGTAIKSFNKLKNQWSWKLI